ncbi:alpha beta-hydrolase [Coniophora puteana RWD-64-598 SS2]|uniref:Alpha beta-hydrolase n=1 Tax=Coniophora puteana (strain RWD-64-598) TaxID=741705 RepID=R7SEQ5_CONPW|nr:alpha beta-hydrolase [Coniophora puteana RWD-64-598 SS2]EIW74192.1 alpha beta-hydrolase [Coniophora puteana RWD-64-598 SS2]
MNSSGLSRPSWTPEIEAGVRAFRDAVKSSHRQIGAAASPTERATLPRSENIPDGVAVDGFVVVPHGVHFAGGDAIKTVQLPKSVVLPPQLHGPRIAPDAVPCFTYERKGRSGTKPEETNVIFFVHGGGNVAGHPADYGTPGPRWVPAISNLAKRFDGFVVAPSYRLASVPENTYPANLQDLWFAYQYLLNQGYQPKNIRLVGESAGGNSVLIITYLLHLYGQGLPHSIAAFGPAADHTYELSDYAKAQADVDILPIQGHMSASDQWLLEPGTFPDLPDRFIGAGARDRKSPLISAMHIPIKDIDDWPRTLIIAGNADQLIDPSRVMHHEAPGKVELRETEGGVHGFWQLPFYGQVKDKAWADVLDFAR